MAKNKNVFGDFLKKIKKFWPLIVMIALVIFLLFFIWPFDSQKQKEEEKQDDLVVVNQKENEGNVYQNANFSFQARYPSDWLWREVKSVDPNILGYVYFFRATDKGKKSFDNVDIKIFSLSERDNPETRTASKKQQVVGKYLLSFNYIDSQYGEDTKKIFDDIFSSVEEISIISEKNETMPIFGNLSGRILFSDEQKVAQLNWDKSEYQEFDLYRSFDNKNNFVMIKNILTSENSFVDDSWPSETTSLSYYLVAIKDKKEVARSTAVFLKVK